ncbi:hypothetical protein NEOC65_001694 [Neochlamydia sp. AcF65]|nr:hypothetical protein [Neochlamydia sp. AcF65]MBS4166604.1 hypothetical protein [Neochlamydia sp. AcF65]
MLNDRVIPWFEEQDVRILRVLTGRGTEYCGAREFYEYELYLAIEGAPQARKEVQYELKLCA